MEPVAKLLIRMPPPGKINISYFTFLGGYYKLRLLRSECAV